MAYSPRPIMAEESVPLDAALSGKHRCQQHPHQNEAIGAISESSLNLTGKVSPYWQYKTETFRISFSPDLIWERFTYPKKTLWAVSPFVYLNKKLNFRQEMTTYFGYTTSTGDSKNYALSQYRRSYRSWYVSDDIIPVTRSLYGNLSYEYKRPIKEISSQHQSTPTVSG